MILRIVIGADGGTRPSTKPHRRWLPIRGAGARWALTPLLGAAFVTLGSIALPAQSAGADQLSSLQSQATQLTQEINATTASIDAAGQQYDQAESQLASVNQQISITQQRISTDQSHVTEDRAILRKAAVQAFITDGSVSTENPLFSGNQKTYGEVSEYSTVAQGDLGSALAHLHTAETSLDSQEKSLQTEHTKVQTEATDASAALAQSQAQNAQLQAEYSQDKGQIATLVAQQQQEQQQQQQQAALAALAAKTTQNTTNGANANQNTTSGANANQNTTSSTSTASGNQAGANTNQSTANVVAPPQSSTNVVSPPPPTSTSSSAGSTGSSGFSPPSNAGQGAIAVAAAESQLGVPYVYAGATPGVGFDCSGLTMWAWAQAGVQLDHYSGAQMAETTPVPVSDLEPGDLLFYGPGGANHVTMYIGGGMMIEAPHTGAVVWETPLNTTYDGGAFAGAGRP